MESKTKKISLILLVFSTAIFLLLLSIKSYYSDSSLIFLEPVSNNWISLLDFSSNSYYMWKFHSTIFKYTLVISSIFKLDFNTALYILNTLIFLVSLFFLSKNISPKIPFLANIFFSLNFIILLCLLEGNKTYLISSIALLPFYILTFKMLLEGQYNFTLRFLSFILASLLLVKTANQFSFFYMLFSAVLIFCVLDKKNFKVNILFYLISLLYSLKYIILAIPFLPKFSFPWYARVVPDDGLIGNITPLLNEGTEIPFLNKNLEISIYYPYIFLICIYLLFIIFRYFKSHDTILKKLSFLISFFILSFIIEIYFSTNVSSIFFLSTIQRIVPSIFSFSLYPIFLFLMLFSFFIFILKRPQHFIFIFILNIILGSILFFKTNYSPLFISDSTISYIKTLQLSKDNIPLKIMLSPSTAVLKEYGIQYYLKKDDLFNKKNFINIRKLKPVLDSNYNKDDLKKIFRNSKALRWSTKKGKQDGDEWIKIITPKKENITGVFLSAGNFKTDFPIKIKIIDCDNGNIILEQKNLGNIEFTSNGYPYYGPQDKTTFLFPKNIKTNCIKIEQTGKNKNFEWSVANIKFMIK